MCLRVTIEGYRLPHALPSGCLVGRSAAIAHITMQVCSRVLSRCQPYDHAGSRAGQGRVVAVQSAPSGRRDVLLGLSAGLILSKPLPVWSEEAEATDASPAPAPAPSPSTPAPTVVPPQTEFVYSFQSDVPANLRTVGYYTIITSNRPGCWTSIARRIQGSQWNELAGDLRGPSPFADMRQAALYIPWALLQRDDYQAATDVRKMYDDFDSHVLDLEAAAIAAESGDGGAERVQQAFILLSASTDSFLSSIPTAYLPKGPKA